MGLPLCWMHRGNIWDLPKQSYCASLVVQLGCIPYPDRQIIHDKTAVFHFSTELVVKKAKVEEMCPRFPEPVPLKHPITSLRVALEKVNLFQQFSIILIAMFYHLDVLVILMVSFTDVSANR